MAKAELGTKRICPETGRKFYDLNKDPIVSPYTGISYPRSMFEAPAAKARTPAKSTVAPEPEVEEEKEDEKVATISLEEADEEAAEGGVVKIEGADVDEEEIDEDETADDTFLPDEEEDDEDDVESIVGDVDDEDT